MFCWEPEGCYHCTKSVVIAPFWFSMEHRWTALTPFWLSAKVKQRVWSIILSFILLFQPPVCPPHQQQYPRLNHLIPHHPSTLSQPPPHPQWELQLLQPLLPGEEEALPTGEGERGGGGGGGGWWPGGGVPGAYKQTPRGECQWVWLHHNTCYILGFTVWMKRLFLEFSQQIVEGYEFVLAKFR